MKKYKIPPFLAALFLFLSVSSQTATAPAIGDGSVGNPYQIATLNNLYWLTQTSSSWSKNFIQTANIDATSTSTWASGAGFSPIGNTTTNYTGTYNGQKYTISNLTINKSSGSSVGFFGYVSSPAVIQNINLQNISVTTSGNYVGSLLGYLNSGTIIGCTSSGTVTVSTYDGSSFGGFIGIFWTSGTVKQCSCSVSVNAAATTSSSNANIGGFVGYLNSSCSIDQCFATGNVVADGAYEGGFAGTMNGTITNSYSTGNVTRVSGKTSTSIAGFVGNLGSALIPAISNCYSSGNIYYTSTTNPTNQGFCSSSVAVGKVSSCYFNGSLSNQSSDVTNGATKKTSSQMQTQSTFSSWDFATPIWVMNPGYNSGFPFLAWQANTWTGSTNTDWNTPTNWSLSIVPISSEPVIIPQTINNPIISTGELAVASAINIQNGAILTLSGSGTLTANNGITVNSGGALIGNSSNITGTVSLQQNVIAQRGYRIFANPFSTSQIDLSSTGLNATRTTANDVKTWSNSSNAWVSAGTGYSSVTIGANTPYACFIRGASTDNITGLTYSGGPTAFTYNVIGTLNGATYTIPSANSANFSLIGNPYVAPVNTIALTGGIAEPYYVYTIAVSGNGRTKAGSWSSVLTSSNSSTIPVLGVIAVKTAGNFSITAATDINTTPTPQTGLFGVNTAIRNIELQLEQAGVYQDKLFIRQDASATENGTDKIDLQKFANDVTNIYTITPDQKQMAIDARSELGSTIPLGISSIAGDYNFRVNNNSLSSGTTVYLQDNLLHTQTALQTGATYNFSITADAATQGEQRFALVFANKTTIAAISDSSNAKFTAKVLSDVVHGNTVTIEIGGSRSPINIVARDINGKILSTVRGVNGTNTVPLGNAASGICIIQISNANATLTQKIIKL